MAKKTARNAIIVVIVIVVISTGIYLGLAYPFPVYSQPVELTGILSETDFDVNIGWPNTQMRIQITLTSVSAIWGYEVRDSTDTYIIGNASISTSTTTITSPWFDASGIYTITVVCIGSLEGTVTIYARGTPFITA
ncbi:MAG: hypothetical protein ACFE89_08935 [Candidatus Hodarchaeota archaeon]